MNLAQTNEQAIEPQMTPLACQEWRQLFDLCAAEQEQTAVVESKFKETCPEIHKLNMIRRRIFRWLRGRRSGQNKVPWRKRFHVSVKTALALLMALTGCATKTSFVTVLPDKPAITNTPSILLKSAAKRTTRTMSSAEMVHPLLLQEITNGVPVKVLWQNSIGSVGADFARLSWKGTNTLKVVYLLTDTNQISQQLYGLSNGPPWVIELTGVNAAGDGPTSNVTFWNRWEDTVWYQSRANETEAFQRYGPPMARWTNNPTEPMRQYRVEVERVRQ